MTAVFVTGSTGRLGSALVARLANRRDLRLLVRGDADAARARFARDSGAPARDAIARGAIRIVTGDLTRDGFGWSLGGRAEEARGLDTIVHLAALTDFADHGDSRHDEVNVAGTLRVAEFAANAGARLIFVSTAYACGVQDGTVRETAVGPDARFRNPYESSKARAESLLLAFCARRGVPLTILRPGVIVPDAPRSGLPTGPGPLVFLEFLTGLDGPATAPSSASRVRFRGDPEGLLNLVSLDSVVTVLERAIDRGATGIFHVTSEEPTRFATMVEELAPYLPGLRFELTASDSIVDLDRVERTLARHCRAYQPYLFATTRHDRERCAASFGATPDFTRADLARSYANHAAAWRRERAAGPSAPEPCAANSIAEYFDRFLPTNAGRRLVPGIESLTARFTVSVPNVGIFHLAIENGVLVEVARADRRSDHIDYESEAPALLEAVRGVVRPADLFFQRRVTIRGDLHRALTTAVALEEFFRLHPFVDSRTA